jgi:sodium pump decarboxylase gamma subunit
MELFRQATTIMVLGMGLVFVFLAMVILLVQATAKLVQWHESGTGENGQKGPEDGDGERVAAVIAVALHDRH